MRERVRVRAREVQMASLIFFIAGSPNIHINQYLLVLTSFISSLLLFIYFLSLSFSLIYFFDLKKRSNKKLPNEHQKRWHSNTRTRMRRSSNNILLSLPCFPFPFSFPFPCLSPFLFPFFNLHKINNLINIYDIDRKRVLTATKITSLVNLIQ